MSRLLSLFLIFLKIHPLTTSGPACRFGHEEAVAGSRFVTEEEFFSDFR